MGTRERKEREFETRRRLILDKAMDLFQKNSFAGVTLDDIASAIEFSKGTIYNHFGSKEEIYAVDPGRAPEHPPLLPERGGQDRPGHV